MKDARVLAYLTADAIMKAVFEFRKANTEKLEGEMPNIYFGLIAEADVYARLAAVPTDVGILAGEEMARRAGAEAALAAKSSDLFDMFAEKNASKESADA